MSARDCWALKKLNETAEAIVETPIGLTNKIILKNTVRQGTVSGPRICAAAIDNINTVGYTVITFYGPRIEINALAYVDDLESAGSCFTANNTIKNCNILEERKKITVSIERGKSGVLIIGDKKGAGNVTAEVKNGAFLEVDEEKYLGTWVDKTGNYMINITKKKPKIPYMVFQTKTIASPKQMGILSTKARLKMMETIIIPSLMYNVEAFATYTNTEIEELEKIQANMLRDLLEVPSSTPYLPLLLETGMWTMESRIAYKKLMLFHNIVNSSNDRIITNVIGYQMKCQRRGTWYWSIQQLLERYNIWLDPKEVQKSQWKKEVKTKVNTTSEEQIRNACISTTKGRTAAVEKYELKPYLLQLPIDQAKIFYE